MVPRRAPLHRNAMQNRKYRQSGRAPVGPEKSTSGSVPETAAADPAALHRHRDPAAGARDPRLGRGRADHQGRVQRRPCHLAAAASASAAEPRHVIRLSRDLRDRNVRRAASPASGIKPPERSPHPAHAGRARRPRRGVQGGTRRRLRLVVRDGGYGPLVPSRRARLKYPPDRRPLRRRP